MSVTITINDGRIEATHNSGRTLWTVDLGEKSDVPSERVAQAIYDGFLYSYDTGQASSDRGE